MFFSKARRISSRFHGCDIFDDFCTPNKKKTDGSERNTKSTIKFLSVPPPPHFLVHTLVSPRTKGFTVLGGRFTVLPERKRSAIAHIHSLVGSFKNTDELYLVVARRGANEKDRERVASKAYQSVERLTKTSHENSDRITSWDKRASFFQYRCFLRAF